MFSLIITIVSIALVVALVAATMYYGGDTLTQGRERADAAAFVSGGQQIAAAAQLYRALHGGAQVDDDELLGVLSEDQQYLTSMPLVNTTADGAWAISSNEGIRRVTIPVHTENVCKSINLQAYGEFELSADVPRTFGCTGSSSSGPFEFVYKF